LGTRFLLTEESGAHPEYKRRALDGGPTLLTRLFGAGWPAAHRVLPNAATDRWLGGDPVEPAWIRALHRATAPLMARAPDPVVARAAAFQRPSSPLLGPQPPVVGGPPGLVEAGPLYAGETVARINDLRPAGELTRELAG
jgi:nitronate monooxygenase